MVHLEDFFSVPTTFFQIIGLTPFETETKVVKYSRFFFWFALWDLGAALVAQAAFFVRGLRGTGNFLPMISAAACISFGALGWEEMLMMWLNRDRIVKLVQFLKEDYPMVPSVQVQFGIERLYKESRMFMISFAVCYLALISAFNFTPLIVNSVEYFSGKSEWKSELPYNMWFPFDPDASIVLYVVVYLLESWAGFCAVVSCLAMNLFLGAIVTQLCLHLKMMRFQLESMQLEKGDVNGAGQLRELIIKHGALIQFGQDLEDIFSVSIFVNQLASSLIICLVGFQVLVSVRLSEIIKFCLFLVSSLLQTLTMSYFGQQIIDNSTSISNAIYNSDWLNADISDKKSLLLILIRSQRPLKISGYKITTVSLSSFAKILSSSYSYYALLRTMYSGDI